MSVFEFSTILHDDGMTLLCLLPCMHYKVAHGALKNSHKNPIFSQAFCGAEALLWHSNFLKEHVGQ